MKKQLKKKLNLGKVTVRDLDNGLDRDTQKAIKGGTGANSMVGGTTNVPVICKP